MAHKTHFICYRPAAFIPQLQAKIRQKYTAISFQDGFTPSFLLYQAFINAKINKSKR
jgi:hypothetical protein